MDIDTLDDSYDLTTDILTFEIVAKCTGLRPY